MLCNARQFAPRALFGSPGAQPKNISKKYHIHSYSELAPKSAQSVNSSHLKTCSYKHTCFCLIIIKKMYISAKLTTLVL